MRVRATIWELAALALLVLVVLSLISVCGSECIYKSRRAGCASNLKRIGELADIYRKNGFDGDAYYVPGVYPEHLGSAWHWRLINTLAPSDMNIFQCPVERNRSTIVDYRGPARDPNSSDTRVEYFAGDRLDNHGDRRARGVNSLTRYFQVVTLTADDPIRWAAYLSSTKD
jgi:hypothetical protein